MNKLNEKLQQMKGKDYLINGNIHKILSFRVNGSGATVVTDKKWIEIETHNDLRDFMEIKDDALAQKNESVATAVMNNNHLDIQDLKNTLIDNIEKLQKDKDYIPQAKAITNNANAIMNMVKLEFEIVKHMKKIK